MLEFRRLTLEDIPLIRPFVQQSTNRACDNTVGVACLWRDYFQTSFALHQNTLIFRMRSKTGDPFFSVPLGEHIADGIYAVEEYCAQHGFPLVFSGTREDADLLQTYFRFDEQSDRRWSDYLYHAEDLRELAGRKFGGQRNHIHYFEKTFLGYRWEEITSQNLADVVAFYRDFAANNQKSSPLFAEEQRKTFELLENYEAFGLPGLVLRLADGQPVAFAVGEQVGDTLFVHTEKANVRYRGAYPMIVREMARRYAVGDIRYINREDDADDEGLRTSKLSYHPCRLIEKFTLTRIE